MEFLKSFASGFLVFSANVAAIFRNHYLITLPFLKLPFLKLFLNSHFLNSRNDFVIIWYLNKLPE